MILDPALDMGLRTAEWMSRALPYGPRKRVKRYVRKEADVVFVSFAKSGRTWVRVMLSRLYHLRYNLPESTLIEFDNLHRLDARVPRILFTHDGDSMKRPDQLQGDKSKYAGKKVVLLTRNPIDVGVSRHFHVRNRAKEARRKEQGKLPLDEFLWNPVGGIPTIVAFLNDWDRARKDIPQLINLRYEDFRAKPEETLGRLAEFLEIGSTAEEIADAVAFASMENLRKREEQNFFDNSRLGQREAGNEDSFKVRKGKVGGYRDYLSPEQATKVEQYVASQLAAGLGYGADADEPSP
jgi:hypothetical protein